MKLTLTIPDDKFDRLEAQAGSLNKTPNQFLLDALDHTIKYNPRENQVLLSGKQVSDISMAVGGKTIRNGDDIVKLFQDNFRIGVGGFSLALDTEDLHTLQAQYQGMGFTKSITYEEYVRMIIKDALSMYLWGSTTGTFTFK